MAVDALATKGAKSSTAMAMSMFDGSIIVFHESGFHQLTPFLC